MSYLTGGRLNVGLIQEQARKRLLCLLEKCDGPKVLWPNLLSGNSNKLITNSHIYDIFVLLYPMTRLLYGTSRWPDRSVLSPSIICWKSTVSWKCIHCTAGLWQYRLTLPMSYLSRGHSWSSWTWLPRMFTGGCTANILSDRILTYLIFDNINKAIWSHV